MTRRSATLGIIWRMIGPIWERHMSSPRHILCIFLVLAGTALVEMPCRAGGKPGESAKTDALKEESKRRVYVLHSGVHTILSDPRKNIAAEKLKAGLEKRGVSAKDIVVLDNPYPTA